MNKNIKYRIVETISHGKSTFVVEYKRLKWWQFGWQSCYFMQNGWPVQYCSYQQCLDTIKLFEKDGVKIDYI